MRSVPALWENMLGVTRHGESSVVDVDVVVLLCVGAVVWLVLVTCGLGAVKRMVRVPSSSLVIGG